ncbi:MAG: ATP-binding cassette domain-containing protein, partial [Proteobacteria bacterium]|nr:ATP-binding cassette domain-containing protein [Pseudomonadota bacterium]
LFEVITGGLGPEGELIGKYHTLSVRVGAGETGALEELETVQHALEVAGGWSAHQRVESVITRLGLPEEKRYEELSGGLKRRVLLARALVSDPDLLLLDEPTNHLDIESIDWLERFLLGFSGTLLFITHDRMLLARLATRIIELDRGRLTSWQCDYRTYLERKEHQTHAETEQNRLFDKKLAEEEKWIRKGIQARRTRNEGRVTALKEMRTERRKRRDVEGTAKILLHDSSRSGSLVVEAEGIGFSYDSGGPVVENFSATIMRGDKIGVIGPNGAGKTTLLKLLLGTLTPTAGAVRLGTNLEVSYFDQHRGALDEEKSIMENLFDGTDQVIIDGKPRHSVSYLQDFLFAPSRARTPVKVLSGGERNRLLLAKLFARASNVLVMDEPTNDLDSETLDLLEELLLGYRGTVLIVSHDRAFLNNVVTSTIVFEEVDGAAQINEYVGGYDDWLRQRPDSGKPAKSNNTKTGTGAETGTEAATKDAAKKTEAKQGKVKREKSKTKLGFNETRELKELPAEIERLEAEQVELYALMAKPDFYKEAAAEKSKARAEKITKRLEEAYARWEELEEMSE